MPPQPIFAQPVRSPRLPRPLPVPLLLTLALHVALLWWLNQSWPVAGAIRYVVFQVLQPSQRDAQLASRAITLLQKPRAANAPTRELPVLGAKPEKSTPLQTTQQLPQPSAQVAEPVPVPTSEPALPLREVAPAPPVMNKPVPEPPVAARPEPVPAAPPDAQVAPTPAPTPVAVAPPIALPEPAPAAATKPMAQSAPPVAPLPAPVPAVAAQSEPAPAPAVQPTQRLQAPPREVEVTASQPAPVGAVVSVVPVAPRAAPSGGAGSAALNGPGGAAVLGPGQGGNQGAAAGLAGLARPLPNASAASAGTASPVPRPINLALPPGSYRSPAPRRSLAEMANEQLRQGQPDKDPLAAGMANGGKTDCLRSGGQGALGGLLAAPVLVARALSGDCPK